MPGRDVDYRGASGAVDFDADHNVVTDYEIWRYDAPGSTEGCTMLVTELEGGRGSFCRFQQVVAGMIP